MKLERASGFKGSFGGSGGCPSTGGEVRELKIVQSGRRGWGRNRGKGAALGLGQDVVLSQPWGCTPNAYRCSVDWSNLCSNIINVAPQMNLKVR